LVLLHENKKSKENVTAKRFCGRKVKYMNIYGNKAAKKMM
jgi:hypothetical protein